MENNNQNLLDLMRFGCRYVGSYRHDSKFENILDLSKRLCTLIFALRLEFKEQASVSMLKAREDV